MSSDVRTYHLHFVDESVRCAAFNLPAVLKLCGLAMARPQAGLLSVLVEPDDEILLFCDGEGVAMFNLWKGRTVRAHLVDQGADRDDTRAIVDPRGRVFFLPEAAFGPATVAIDATHRYFAGLPRRLVVTSQKSEENLAMLEALKAEGKLPWSTA